MKVLVANLGSTSFKYRLFDLEHETQLARGGIDRIGQRQKIGGTDQAEQDQRQRESGEGLRVDGDGDEREKRRVNLELGPQRHRRMASLA